MLSRRLAGVVAIATIAACSPAPSPSQKTDAAERAAMAPLKASYPDAVMGFDFHGTTLDVSIDMNGLISLDEDQEDALKKAAVSRWRSTWRASHPHQHGTLTIRLIDFQGRPEFTATTKA